MNASVGIESLYVFVRKKSNLHNFSLNFHCASLVCAITRTYAPLRVPRVAISYTRSLADYIFAEAVHGRRANYI